MKKIMLVCLSVLMTAGLVEVKAQPKISGGAKVEANMSNFFLSDLDNYKSTMKVGATVGGFLKVDLHENFAIQPEMLFFFRNSKMEVGKEEDDFQQWGMQIPVYAVGQMNMGKGKGYVGIGPYVGFGFDAKMKDEDLKMYKKVNGETPMNRWDFGLGAMVGYEFSNGIQINAGYQMGLIDQLDADKDNATMRTQTVSLGVGYRF
jgi:hypothetical protein